MRDEVRAQPAGISAGKSLRVSVWRGNEKGGRYERFDVPAMENQTVLDVVSWIQQNVDATLTYRFSCRVGMCGSCAMMVDGKPRWTCRTLVKKVVDGNRLTVAPLRNLPVVKDLAADMDPFFKKWIKAEGRHHPTETRHDPMPVIRPEDPGRAAANKAIECINCSICYASCDTVAGNPDFLGPAALQRAWTLYNDAKDADKQSILEAVSSTGGCQNCHSQGSCKLYCPYELDPLSAILGLKNASAKAFFTERR